MPRDCPACGTVNPDSAPACDCGYDFHTPVAVHGGGPQPPSFLVWLIYLGFVLSGVALFGLFVFVHFYGTTPEEELTLVEGIPHDVSGTRLNLGRRHSTDVLHFSVGDHRTEYGSKDPKFEEVLEAVTRGEPIQIWVSTKQETVFPRAGWVPLYKMSVQSRPVLTYSESVDPDTATPVGGMLCGGFVLALGLWGATMWYRARRRHVAWVRLEECTRTRVEDIPATETGQRRDDPAGSR